MPRSIHAHTEQHRSHHVGWLRASVLGANDGLISTSSLVTGLLAAQAEPQTVLLSAVAALSAGALSMAAGEYVSVSSQADTEQADIARETAELREQPERELAELTHIYTQRGLSPELAAQVAQQLTHKGALDAHLRDELGITARSLAQPMQAAWASAAAFSAGAALPILLIWLMPLAMVRWGIPLATILMLAVLGAVAAALGGASQLRGALRMVFWGAVAMGITALIGRLFGTTVA